MTLNRGSNGYRVLQIDLSDSTSVAASGTNTQTLQPPTGSIYEVFHIDYFVLTPGATSTGTHKLECQTNNSKLIFRVQALHSSSVQIVTCEFAGDSSELPSQAVSQVDLISGSRLISSNSYPLKFVYSNNTDAAQANTRTLVIMVKIKPEC